MSRPLDLLLVIPQQPATAKFLSLSSGITQPLGAGYLASYLSERGYRVQIHDNDINRWPINKVALAVRACNPLCVGIATFTNSFRNGLLLAQAVKDMNPKTKVIMGGPHASALPQYALRHPAVDFVVLGEGEQTMHELLRALKSGLRQEDISGIVFKDNGQIIHNPPRQLLPDIDTLPLPAYHLMPMDKYYLPASRRMGSGKIGTIITGRGCPHRCTFCSRAVFGNNIRLRKPEKVVSEMELLSNRYGVRELLLWDDVFTIDEGRAIEICRRMTHAGLDIAWSCSSRADRASEGLFSEMAKAGCKELLLGAESGSQIILDDLKKDIKLSQVKESVRLCRKYGIRSFCTFVLGTPKETNESLMDTLDFVKKLNPDYALFCLMAPLPGSPLFDEAVSRNSVDLTNVNWDNFISVLSTEPPPLQIGSLSRQELVRWQKKLFREFYLRPIYIARHLAQMKAPGHVRESLRGFLALMGHQWHKFRYD